MVKCKDCGLLGVRKNYDGEVVEATESIRSEGKHGSLPVKFICCVASAFFPEIEHASKHRIRGIGLERQEAVDANLKAIDTDIDCLAHQDWVPGKTPKEHEEMTTLQILLDMKQQIIDLKSETLRLSKAFKATDQIHHNENRDDRKLTSADTRRHFRIHVAIATTGIVVGAIVSVVTAYFTTLANLGQ